MAEEKRDVDIYPSGATDPQSESVCRSYLCHHQVSVCVLLETTCPKPGNSSVEDLAKNYLLMCMFLRTILFPFMDYGYTTTFSNGFVRVVLYDVPIKVSQYTLPSTTD